MIYIPIARSLNMAQNIRNSNPSQKTIKRANDSIWVAKNTIPNQWFKPAMIALSPWSSPLPFDMNIPIVPYI